MNDNLFITIIIVIMILLLMTIIFIGRAMWIFVP